VVAMPLPPVHTRQTYRLLVGKTEGCFATPPEKLG
jgi:hypothetical protein